MTGLHDHSLAEWLIERFGDEGEQAGLLDEDLVVGYAEGRLDEAERDAVEALLARDPEAREMLGLVPPAAAVVAPPARRRPRMLVWAAAAAVLCALGLTWWNSRTQTDIPPADRLLAYAERLAEEDAGTFAGLPARLRSDAPLALPPKERGALRVLMPQGELLDDTVEVRWTAVAGATRYEVEVATEEGGVVDRAATTERRHAVSLSPGRYLARIRTTTPFGQAEGATHFQVADAARRAAHARAVEVIESVAPASERQLLRAWYSLEAGRFENAAQALAAHRAAYPDDPRSARVAALLEPLSR